MPKKSRIVKEWDEAAESWVDFVNQGKDYFRDELNNPGMLRLIGNIRRKSVLDVACGEGYNTRQLAGKGAMVTGIDLSEKLIEHARWCEEKNRLGIDYHVMDSADLSWFPAKHFDLVTCFMALMDIENYDDALGEVARVLKDNGRFVFSITHPCFEYCIDSEKIEEKMRYFVARRERVPWEMERLLKPFKTTSFHRTLTDYSNRFHKHGFLVKKLLEPKPTKRETAKFQQLRQVLFRPQSIVFELVKDPVRSKNPSV